MKDNRVEEIIADTPLKLDVTTMTPVYGITVGDVERVLDEVHPDAKIRFKCGETMFNVDSLEVDQSFSMKRGDLSGVLVEATLVFTEAPPPITDALTDDQFAAVEAQKDATLPAWQARLLKERDELGQKLAKLRGAIKQPDFRLLLEPAREKLVVQETIMFLYYEILGQRIKEMGA